MISFSNHIIFVLKQVPLKQGLKQLNLGITDKKVIVLKQVPLKQGLKLPCKPFPYTMEAVLKQVPLKQGLKRRGSMGFMESKESRMIVRGQKTKDRRQKELES